jgi:hypothetical protein
VIDNGPATEDEMILAFLRAELLSPRFGPHYAQLLRLLRNDERLVTQADLADPREDLVRKQLLAGIRGYGTNTFLFAGFPPDVQWRHITLTPSEVGDLHYANEPTWLALSAYTRRITIGAQNVTTNPAVSANVLAVTQAIQRGTGFPPLIAATTGTGPFVLIEGHTRATAYAITSNPADLILGTSPNMIRWRYW